MIKELIWKLFFRGFSWSDTTSVGLAMHFFFVWIYKPYYRLFFVRSTHFFSNYPKIWWLILSDLQLVIKYVDLRKNNLYRIWSWVSRTWLCHNLCSSKLWFGWKYYWTMEWPSVFWNTFAKFISSFIWNGSFCEKRSYDSCAKEIPWHKFLFLNIYPCNKPDVKGSPFGTTLDKPWVYRLGPLLKFW